MNIAKKTWMLLDIIEAGILSGKVERIIGPDGGSCFMCDRDWKHEFFAAANGEILTHKTDHISWNATGNGWLSKLWPGALKRAKERISE